jgi:hypothetical protein
MVRLAAVIGGREVKRTISPLVLKSIVQGLGQAPVFASVMA